MLQTAPPNEITLPLLSFPFRASPRATPGEIDDTSSPPTSTIRSGCCRVADGFSHCRGARLSKPAGADPGWLPGGGYDGHCCALGRAGAIRPVTPAICPPKSPPLTPPYPPPTSPPVPPPP